MPNYHVRVHRPYDDISGICEIWSSRSVSSIVFEHEPDEKVRRIHCHMLIYGVDVKEEALKRMWKDKPNDISGNGGWSFSDTYKEDGQELQMTWESRSKILTYLTKGKYEEKLIKNISKQEVDEARSKWVNYKSPDLKKAKSLKQQQHDKQEVIDKVKERYSASHQCDRYCEPTQHLGIIYNLTIEELNTRKIRWHVYDLDRYALPAFTADYSNRVSLVAELVRKHFRQ